MQGQKKSLEKQKNKNELDKHYNMQKVTLEQVNRNILSLKKEMDELKELIEENNLDLSEEAKKQIIESRKRPISEFISHNEVKKKFL